MSAASRTKGASAERELAALLLDELGIRLHRRLEQCQRGGCGLAVHPDEAGPVADRLRRLAIEVKRHREATPGLIDRWWRQAVTQAEADGKVPVLAYRADRCPWRVVVPLAEVDPYLPTLTDDATYTAELSLLAFAAVVREAD
jgi:Holliday junction resolvase